MGLTMRIKLTPATTLRRWRMSPLARCNSCLRMGDGGEQGCAFMYHEGRKLGNGKELKAKGFKNGFSPRARILKQEQRLLFWNRIRLACLFLPQLKLSRTQWRKVIRFLTCRFKTTLNFQGGSRLWSDACVSVKRLTHLMLVGWVVPPWGASHLDRGGGASASSLSLCAYVFRKKKTLVGCMVCLLERAFFPVVLSKFVVAGRGPPPARWPCGSLHQRSARVAPHDDRGFQVLPCTQECVRPLPCAVALAVSPFHDVSVCQSRCC